jgi:hypothetical protein
MRFGFIQKGNLFERPGTGPHVLMVKTLKRKEIKKEDPTSPGTNFHSESSEEPSLREEQEPVED